MGAHKNPAKHVIMRLLEVLDSEELEELPEVVHQAEEALDMLSANNAPVNARNPFYSVVLSTFLDVGRDRLAQTKGRLTGQGAVVREQLFDYTSRVCTRALAALPAAMSKKPDVAKIAELLFSVIVKTKLFYRGAAGPTKRAMSEAEAAEARAKSNAMVKNLQVRFNALKAAGGGATRRRSNSTRRRAATRRARY